MQRWRLDTNMLGCGWPPSGEVRRGWEGGGFGLHVEECRELLVGVGCRVGVPDKDSAAHERCPPPHHSLPTATSICPGGIACVAIPESSGAPGLSFAHTLLSLQESWRGRQVESRREARPGHGRVRAGARLTVGLWVIERGCRHGGDPYGYIRFRETGRTYRNYISGTYRNYISVKSRNTERHVSDFDHLGSAG